MGRYINTQSKHLSIPNNSGRREESIYRIDSISVRVSGTLKMIDAKHTSHRRTTYPLRGASLLRRIDLHHHLLDTAIFKTVRMSDSPRAKVFSLNGRYALAPVKLHVSLSLLRALPDDMSVIATRRNMKITI